ncbi:MAG: COG1361 S-layer family protein [Candidatus Nanohaloarchaea archaeon]
MKRTTPRTTAFKIAIAFALVTFSLGTASAVPELDAVSYDPAFISAGDRVEISANMHEEQVKDRTWNEDMHLKAVLKPGNRLTREYVTIEKSRDESIGFLYPEGAWNQRYQVKIDSDAPTGEYRFEIHIQYLKNGDPVSIPTGNGSTTLTYIEEFTMPVDNEGVDLSSNVVKTEPSVPRPGDDYVETRLSFTNTGNKPLEEIEIKPATPEMVEPSFSRNEKFYIDRIPEGKSASRMLSLNLDEDLQPGLHWINLSATYEDGDSNQYSEELQVPLRVEGRPDLELVGGKTEMKAGATEKLRVKIRNKGAQDAESVTARVIAERTQPFSLKDRSNYIGEIEPGETAEAVMKISSDRAAALKTHQLKVQLRATGDSEEGDNSVYTFTEEAPVELTGRSRSPLVIGGIVAALLVLAATLYRYGIPGRGGSE